MMRLEGKTASGRTVSIEGPVRPSNSMTETGIKGRVWIDGEEATVEDVARYRDGGTRIITTDRGRITESRRFGQEPYDDLDGERLEPWERP